MTTRVRQDWRRTRRRAHAARAAAALGALAMLAGCPSGCTQDQRDASVISPASGDTLTWKGSVAADSNRTKVLTYARKLPWKPQQGDSAVVSPATNAVAVIDPNQHARKYDQAAVAEGRFIARIRPKTGRYDRFGMVAGDTNYIYVWVQFKDTTTTGRSTLIFESDRAPKSLTVYPRPRTSGPHADKDTVNSYASWTPDSNARLGASAPGDLRHLGLSSATLHWFAARSPSTPLPLAVIARPWFWLRQGSNAAAWADCSQYCCVVN